MDILQISDPQGVIRRRWKLRGNEIRWQPTRTAKTARRSASRSQNALRCLRQGALLPLPPVASDAGLPVMLARVVPAVGRSATGCRRTSAAAPRPRPSGMLRSNHGSAVFGMASVRMKLPRLYASACNWRRTAFAAKDRHDRRVHLITPLPSLMYCSQVPRWL